MDRVITEYSTEVEEAESFSGHVAYAVRFNHNENGLNSAILGLTERGALDLAAQLVNAVNGR